MALIGDKARRTRFGGKGGPLAKLAQSMTSVRVEESLSSPFEVCVELLSDTAPDALRASQILGVEETVVIDEMAWKGVVHSLVHVANRNDESFRYRALIVPRLWYLSQATNHRLFQKCSTADIISEIFSEYGLPMPANAGVLASEPRDCCMQFGESDLDFVLRLIAEDGVFLCFRHDNGQSTMRFLVAPDGQPVKVRQEDFSGLSFSLASHVGGVELVDFDPSDMSVVTETLKSKGKQAWKGPPTRHFGDGLFAGGDYQLRKLSSQRVKAAARQLIEHRESLGNGTSCELELPATHNAFRSVGDMLPGCQISGLDEAAMFEGGRLVLTRRVITASESFDSGFDGTCTLYCSAAIDQLRPAVPRKPASPGLLSAEVVQLRASESDTASDPCRLLAVRFPWTAADESASWLRVVQGYAGSGWGASFVPRIGQEVLVDFINGDIDRPVVVGALYNHKNQGPPYTQHQSGYRTASKQYNELRFDDKPDAEQVHLEAGRDLNILVHNDAAATVKGNETRLVEKDHSTEIKGNDKLDVTGDATTTVKGKRKDSTTGKHAVDSTDAIELKVGACTITVKNSGITIEACGNKITLDAGGVAVKGTALKLNSDTNAELKGNAAVTVQGSAMTEVKSSGITKVQGSMTMIN